ncbi:inosine/xanthosine triphosphatase [uncultured Sunxiuqinia sp.]|uniref:inosine/xanthosine triphosphatase n=1 Tax=uncultured Sunxiuqinia sp. TaxID=1573825 RepID=UPI002603E7B3|nr:inosine/xanthosine triphosphatase [uncultured Sunxiuqinia sp.]
MNILIASQNPVKVNAVKEAFKICFSEPVQVYGRTSDSGVSAQPLTDEETRTGARNRVQGLLQSGESADYFVGIEGGIELVDGSLQAFAWIVVSDGEKQSLGRSGSFELPPEIARLIAQGMELGEADDHVFEKQNSKQQNGAVGLLTQDRVTRQSLYQHGLVLALIPFMNKGLYP